jgi:TetR/AcrR family transcriptional repressor of nem operon
MRYGPDHKDAVRARIVDTAARRFRLAGFSGAGIGDVMRRLKLTHGGFYRHFASKDHLFEAALEAAAVERSRHLVTLASAASERPVHAVIEAYLSELHCNHPENGCPLAALGADIARAPARTREACHRVLLAYARQLQRFMPDATEEARQRRAELLFSAMAGTLTFARTMPDRAVRRAWLADARAFFGHTVEGTFGTNVDVRDDE